MKLPAYYPPREYAAVTVGLGVSDVSASTQASRAGRGPEGKQEILIC